MALVRAGGSAHSNTLTLAWPAAERQIQMPMLHENLQNHFRERANSPRRYASVALTFDLNTFP